ncbi:hypothetical protein E3N88_16127 [Mikania micrantha]|uniref:Uncharacterized protein n=1 Tax=Mikania micrantha TaxID=192012 RepID=A0A5N6NYS7_9ASTR|nr:hypothetical protein E3N88_16127 [Mikania micrantha]
MFRKKERGENLAKAWNPGKLSVKSSTSRYATNSGAPVALRENFGTQTAKTLFDLSPNSFFLPKTLPLSPRRLFQPPPSIDHRSTPSTHLLSIHSPSTTIILPTTAIITAEYHHRHPSPLLLPSPYQPRPTTTTSAAVAITTAAVTHHCSPFSDWSNKAKESPYFSPLLRVSSRL